LDGHTAGNSVRIEIRRNTCSAGLDIRTGERNKQPMGTLAEKWRNFLTQEKNENIVLIAVIRDRALGGSLELALSADILIAESNAKLAFPEVNLGLMPGLGGTQILTRRVGPYKAAELLMLGKEFTAEEARDMGLVNYVFDEADLEAEVEKLVKLLDSKPPESIKRIKKAIRIAQNVSLEEGFLKEGELFNELLLTDEAQKRIRNFLEKRDEKRRLRAKDKARTKHKRTEIA
jgi:enoyl-CoA hydratase